MVNALQLAIDFHNQLPENERPELTDGYQGFYHLMDVTGSVEEARASYIIRDFEKDAFEARKAAMQSIADKMNQELGSDRVTLNLTDQYYNMKEVIEKDMTPITIAKAVMEDLGITPIIEPIRGGTDGSKFPLWESQLQISLLVAKTCMDVLNMLAFRLWNVQLIPSLVS